MDFGRIITVFNDLKNNNISGTAPSYTPEKIKVSVLENLVKAKDFLRYSLEDAIICLEDAILEANENEKGLLKDIITYIKRKDVIQAQEKVNHLITVHQLQEMGDAMLGENVNSEKLIDILNSAGGYLADYDKKGALDKLRDARFWAIEHNKSQKYAPAFEEIRELIYSNRSETAYHKLQNLIKTLKEPNESDIISGELEEPDWLPESRSEFNCGHCYDTGVVDCSNCDGRGFFKDYEDTIMCPRCEGAGNFSCTRCGGDTDAVKIKKGNELQDYEEIKSLSESADAYGAGEQWAKDEMDFPEEAYFKDFLKDIAAEKVSDEDINDHDLTVNDQLEQEGLEESKLTEWNDNLRCVCGHKRLEHDEVGYCDVCNNCPGFERDNNLEESFNDDMSQFVKGFIQNSENKRRAEQVENEIRWCQEAIKKLEAILVKKPSKIKEIKQLQHQIREKELKLAFDPSYGGEVRELPVERQMLDKLEESREKCEQCGTDTTAPGIGLCDDCYTKSYEKSMVHSNKPKPTGVNLGRRDADKSISETMSEYISILDSLMEVAPPDEEVWVKKNKKRFKKEYGDKKGTEILYATAWKNHNKKADESIDVYAKLAKRKLEGKCIGCGNEPCTCKTKGKLRNRKNLGKSEWREPRIDADVDTINRQLFKK